MLVFLRSSAKSFPVSSYTSDLVRHLGFSGLAKAADLRARLGVSPQTLGRLLEGAGEEVIRIGRARATQYARTRHVESLGRRVPVVQVNEQGAIAPRGQLRLLWGRRTWWEREDQSKSRLFEGLPPALADMTPQGYLGRGFATRHAEELRLPQRVTDWSDDHCLIALARRGEDCVGNLLLGEESLSRFFKYQATEVRSEQFPELARQSASGDVGSFAGGERPKFGAFVEGRQVLVKFASEARTAAAIRWRDLVWCEWRSLETLRVAGVEAAPARCLDIDGWRFLEVERFDRVGLSGRRAALSLMALANEELGSIDSWSAAAPQLRHRPFLLSETDARRLRWLDVFGHLIGNTDRHFGNVSFLANDDGGLRLAPAYDMLPMILAPSGEDLPARPVDFSPPSASNLDVWPDAARWATSYWQALSANPELQHGVRAFAAASVEAIAELAARIVPGFQATAG